MATKPMVAVSVWGGAHDGDRILIDRSRLGQPRELRFLGHLYTPSYDDQTGWRAIFTGYRADNR
ncbi:hypothetical protein ACVBEQ_04670 [Nakamurella sp. GG22]